MHGLIEGYSSVVQVSESVIHVYCEAPFLPAGFAQASSHVG